MRTQTDPRIIRRLLNEAEATGYYRTATLHNIHPRTIYRWRARRAESGGIWPTIEDIFKWRSDREINGEKWARQAAHQYRYRQRVYLNRGPTQVPSIGTSRRLQALFAIGWTTADMAHHLGAQPARVGHLMNSLYPYVYEATAKAVSDMYDRLSMVIPDDHPGPRSRGQVWTHSRARREARKRHYAPPLAWDNIDDPAAEPEGVSRREPVPRPRQKEAGRK